MGFPPPLLTGPAWLLSPGPTSHQLLEAGGERRERGEVEAPASTPVPPDPARTAGWRPLWGAVSRGGVKPRVHAPRPHTQLFWLGLAEGAWGMGRSLCSTPFPPSLTDDRGWGLGKKLDWASQQGGGKPPPQPPSYSGWGWGGWASAFPASPVLSPTSCYQQLAGDGASRERDHTGPVSRGGKKPMMHPAALAVVLQV